METNEIKKYLYKENPTALLGWIKNGVAHYTSYIKTGRITFAIPCNDMGEASFHKEMHSKYLIRWIDQFIKEEPF